MNVDQAAALWGCSRKTVINRIHAGVIPGCRKELIAGKRGGIEWVIPDNAQKPNPIKRYTKEPKDAPIPNVGRTDPVDYVWQNQHASIKRLMRKLGLSFDGVRALCDQAMAKYL